MAKVTKLFRDNFDLFSADRVDSGEFTQEEMAELKALIRKDIEPGPDQIRQEVDCLMIAGVKIPTTIDDDAERYRLWNDFFAAEAEDIKLRRMVAA